MSDWRNIETAPKKGWLKLKGSFPSRFSNPPVIEVLGKYEDGGWTEGWVDSRHNTFYPTHWQPADPPPPGGTDG